MKLSVYTAVKNGLLNDLHFEAMIRHHLPLADEIVVNEGHSTDGTYEVLTNIDPKVRVFRSHWERPRDQQWCVAFKNEARLRCTGDWCIHLDADEFIPEWEFPAIRTYLETTDAVLVPTRFVNFYGNYRVYHREPERIRWPYRKMNIHRNLSNVEFWGDGSNVKLAEIPFSWDTCDREFTVHHFGAVREPGTLRRKWSVQARAVTGSRRWFRPPTFLFKFFPHEWIDQQFMEGLALYQGDPIKAVRDNPNEFVRDDFKVLKHLEQQV